MTDQRAPSWMEAFEAHSDRFYAQLGRCIAMYQTVEDYLPQVFSAALDAPQDQAVAIFDVARGLDAKLRMIKAAMSTHQPHLRKRWSDLAKRVKTAADARHEMAHGEPVHAQGGPQFAATELGPHKMIELGQMEIWKKTNVGTSKLTLDDMVAEASRSDVLLNQMIALECRLTNKPPPPNLQEELY